MPETLTIDRPLRDMGKKKRAKEHASTMTMVTTLIQTTPYILACQWRDLHDKKPWEALIEMEDAAKRLYIREEMAKAKSLLSTAPADVLGKAGRRRRAKFFAKERQAFSIWQDESDRATALHEELDARLDFLLED